MKTRLFLIGLLSLLAASCSLNEIVEFEGDFVLGTDEFYVTIDEQPGSDTKVYADENLKVLWNEDDRFTFFNMNDHNQEYVFLGDDGDNSGRVIPVGTVVTGDPLEHIYAIYPYAESTSIDAFGKISFTLPSEQSYHEKSFGIGANTMVSVTDENKIRFKNVGGYLSLKFYGEGVSVSSIVLKSNGGELLSGPCTIETSSGLPVVKMDSGSASDQITIVCDPPVALGATSSEAVQFIFVLPPVTLSEGFTVKVTTPEGAVFEKSSDKERVIGRSAITPLGAMAVYPELPGNISFADQTVKSICVKYWDDNEDGGLSYEEAASVESLMVDASLTKAGDEVSAFAGTGITTFDELVYFTGLIEIEEGAFENCKGLKSVTISEQVGRIGDNAFNGCKNLESITLTSTTPPEIGEGVFDNTNNCPIYVPEEAVEAYLSEWSEYTEYVERIAGAILPEAFPDENFRAYVFKNFDMDKDGLLSEEECEEVTSIDVNTENIYSLEGIGYFKHLKNLYCKPKYSDSRASLITKEWHLFDENGNDVIGSLVTLDLSENTELVKLQCKGNQLTSLDLSNCIELAQLDCSRNSITELDLSQNTKITSLDCSWNDLISLVFCNTLRNLFCAGNELTELDLSCVNLYNLDCAANNLTCLNVSNCSFLRTLDCGFNSLTTLDISVNNELERLDCIYNSLTSLDVRNNVNLTSLDCYGNEITALDVSNNTGLERLECWRNQLTVLDVSNNLALKQLGCHNNPMSVLYLAIGQEISNLRKNEDTEIVYKNTKPAADEIWYTSCDGSVIEPQLSGTGGFGDASVVSNTYTDGIGVIKFDKPLATIGYSVFGYADFTSVTLPEGLTTVEMYAFGYCRSMTSISFPSTLTSIGAHAIRDCYSLTSVTIPDSVTSIGSGAFDNCRSLQSFNGKYASSDHRWLIVDGSLIGFAPSGLTSVTIPSGVTEIETYAFHNCSNLTSVVIPEGVTRIGGSVFAGCTSLVSVTIPESMTSIGSGAFSQCYSLQAFDGKFASDDQRCLVVDGAIVGFAPAGLTDYTVPSIVTNIAYSSFSGCSSLTSITVPASVTQIGEYAFKGCSSLTSITFDSVDPPAFNSVQVPTAIFDNTNNCPIYVPALSVDAYKHMQESTTWGGWAVYADRIQPRVAIPELVDLGLSVKWASFNLGATAPEESGDYYAWGETLPYYSNSNPLTWKQGKSAGYAWASFKYNPSGDGKTFTKYVGSDYLTLQSEDDAASINLGGEWRMPTYNDFVELLQDCIWTWTANNGVNGYLVQSKTNENSIFLPVTGSYLNKNLRDEDHGCYWSSSSDILNEDPVLALWLNVNPEGFSYTHCNYGSGRHSGLCIRPVME